MSPRIAWLGDDFTGSAAVLEVLAFAGVPSVLFLAAPDAGLLARFPAAQGVGIATDARARPPAWMDANLPPLFAALRATGADLVHYKICSTLDSAPQVGSVGRAMELGLPPGGWAAVLVPSPRIGRWQAFGTLFARTPGGVARLDRHPTMSRHPVTPMDEADVRRHLARQTALPMGLVDLLDLAADPAAALARERAAGARAVVFDALDESSLAAAGRAILAARPDLLVGSQGVEDALAPLLAESPAPPAPRPGPAQVALVSGSCSPDTAAQIAAAEAGGYAVLRLDPLAGAEGAQATEAEARAALSAGRSVLVHTARGPDDPAIARTRAAGVDPAAIGRALGRLLGRLTAGRPGLRLAAAGGDTSGAVTAELGVLALTAEARFAPAVPLLHAHAAEGPPRELVLKGGQMGAVDLFLRLRDGA